MVSGCAILAFLAIDFIISPCVVEASWGDENSIFQNVRRHCLNSNCSTAAKLDTFRTRQPAYLRALGWDCWSECTYESMWYLTEKAVDELGTVPQFYGKWPFVRFLGMQEPASATFSVLNGLAAVVMLTRFRKKVPEMAPLYEAWHGYFAIVINAWVWSTVFHFRDLIWTEKMDYISGFSLIVSGLVMLILRLFCLRGNCINFKVAVPSLAPLIIFFLSHSFYLGLTKFSYGYNMKVNLTLAVVNSVGWIAWSVAVYSKQPYTWKAAVPILLANGLLLLELGDFSPLWWVFDAHSLWHGGTAPLALIFYSFVIDDSLYLYEEYKKSPDYRRKGV